MSAEQKKKSKQFMHINQPNRKLREVLANSWVDLDFNSAGQLSPDQKIALRRQAAPYRRITIVSFVSFLFFVEVLDFAMADLFELTLLWKAPIVFLPVILAAPYAWRWLVIERAIRAWRVAHVEGYVEMTDIPLGHARRFKDDHFIERGRRRRIGNWIYRLKIGDKVFWVPRSVQDAFEKDEIYRVYYTEVGKLVVAGERLQTLRKAKDEASESDFD